MSDQASLTKVSLGALTKYFLWLGTFGFGGIIALAIEDAGPPPLTCWLYGTWLKALRTSDGG